MKELLLNLEPQIEGFERIAAERGWAYVALPRELVQARKELWWVGPGYSINVSEPGDFLDQMDDAEEFFQVHSDTLRRLRELGVASMELNFGLEVEDCGPSQYLQFSEDFLLSIAKLGICLAVTLGDLGGDNDDDNGGDDEDEDDDEDDDDG